MLTFISHDKSLTIFYYLVVFDFYAWDQRKFFFYVFYVLFQYKYSCILMFDTLTFFLREKCLLRETLQCKTF